MVCSVIMISMNAAPILVTMDPAMMLSTNTPALVTQDMVEQTVMVRK